MVIFVKKNSIWLDYPYKESSKALEKDITTDVLIIGGGMTGLSVSYFLKDSNLKVCLVDKSLIAHGVSSKMTAKISYLQGNYLKIKNSSSLSNAKKYFLSQKEAIGILLNIINKEHISCNLEEVHTYIYADTPKEIVKLQKEKNLLSSWQANIEEVKKDNYYAISTTNYVFHPLKYLYALKRICEKKIDIYENTEIKSIKKEDNYFICSSNNYTIKAKKVVLACHYPFFLFPFLLPLRSYVEKSYLMAYSYPYNNHTALLSQNKSYRFYEDKKIYKIYLSNSHNIGNHLNRKKEYYKLINSIKERPEYLWENDDLITIDYLPFIGKLKSNEENILLSTGYNTWGTTNATLAGKILSDIILKKENPYISLFSLQRNYNYLAIFNSLSNIFINGKSYLINKINPSKKWYSSDIFFKKNKAIIKSNNSEHIVINKCPHMGCPLIFNEVENVWECPCHASKFDIDGKCLKGPSKEDISYQEKK